MERSTLSFLSLLPRLRTCLLATGSLVLLTAAAVWGHSAQSPTTPPAVCVPSPAARPAVAIPAPRPGLSAAQVPLLGPLWQHEFTGPLEERPTLQVALDDAVVFRAGDELLRLRLSDGILTTRARLPQAGASWDNGTALKGRVFVSGAASKVLALDGTTLATLWSHAIPERLSSQVLAVGPDKLLAVGASDGYQAPYALHLLDATSGRLLWSHTLGGDRRSCSFTADAARIYVECSSRSSRPSQWWIAALDVENGVERWRQSLASSCRELHAHGPWLAWLESYPMVAVLADAATGTPLLRLPTTTNYAQPRLALDGGELFYFDAEHRLVARDIASGKVRWQHADPEAPIGSEATLAVAGPVYLLDAEGDVTVHDRTSGARLWSWNTGETGTALTLPDDTGARPLTLVGRDQLMAFAPGARPVPVERAVFSGKIHNLSPAFPVKEIDLRVGHDKARIDAHGNYQAVVEGRGKLGLRANTGAGFTREHGAASRCPSTAESCPILVPLKGRKHYRVDLDVMVVPEDCH